ncbi:TIGR04282 family arsenosugar biosynthesis glycosyltransferase [Malonomonas rubra]|uniref:TIGR04282 family arsenosugar biosynthesis glycosyltransferase n=1 Tax=Malonomonas rubra TaxID=57040 RepID=UPI0026F20707|nr:TIGR04282 family arsenosugar biosynthesis glycosyltransferase [Malonomonas rubra]
MDTVDNKRKTPFKKPILGIFAKQPLAGKCKTRLCPPLSFVEAADLYRVSLEETVARMQAAGCFDLAICYLGERRWFEQSFPGVRLIEQSGVDLGERMANALQGFLRQGYRQALLIGSDAPDLPLSLVEQAIAGLQKTEVVLVPADDGGYVLIGEARHHSQLFEDISWSSPKVLAETLEKIEQYEIPALLLDGWEDFDDLPSLQLFLRRSPQCRTAEYLRHNLTQHFS